MMKKHLNRIFLALLVLLTITAVPALAGSRSETMLPPSVSGNGRDITVSWTNPSFDGVDKIEVQLVKQNTNGSGYSNYGTKKTVDADEDSWDFTVSAKGYYKARVRAKDVNNNYTAWSAVSLDTATVTSEDVSGSSGSSVVSSKKGPGADSITPTSGGTYVSGGPGASNSVSQGNGSSGNGYGSSSQTINSKKVMVNTYTALGWQNDGKGRWYLYEDGSYPVSSWRKIDGSFYHFNENGYMDWNRWIKEGNNWYFTTADGKMAVGWNNISEVWYYMNPANGIMYTQGEHIIDGKYYCMNADGSMVHDAWVNGHFYNAKGVRQDG